MATDFVSTGVPRIAVVFDADEVGQFVVHLHGVPRIFPECAGRHLFNPAFSIFWNLEDHFIGLATNVLADSMLLKKFIGGKNHPAFFTGVSLKFFSV